jgi:hypothetical protein
MLRWAEGASLIREQTDLIVEQIAWSGFFWMSAGIDRGDNVPICDVDCFFVATSFVRFGFDQDMLRAICDKRVGATWPSYSFRESFLRSQEAASLYDRLGDVRQRALLCHFADVVVGMVKAGEAPTVPLDLVYLHKVAIESFTPLSIFIAILSGEELPF